MIGWLKTLLLGWQMLTVTAALGHAFTPTAGPEWWNFQSCHGNVAEGIGFPVLFCPWSNLCSLHLGKAKWLRRSNQVFGVQVERAVQILSSVQYHYTLSTRNEEPKPSKLYKANRVANRLAEGLPRCSGIDGKCAREEQNWQTCVAQPGFSMFSWASRRTVDGHIRSKSWDLNALKQWLEELFKKCPWLVLSCKVAQFSIFCPESWHAGEHHEQFPHWKEISRSAWFQHYRHVASKVKIPKHRQYFYVNICMNVVDSNFNDNHPRSDALWYLRERGRKRERERERDREKKNWDIENLNLPATFLLPSVRE